MLLNIKYEIEVEIVDLEFLKSFLCNFFNLIFIARNDILGFQSLIKRYLRNIESLFFTEEIMFDFADLKRLTGSVKEGDPTKN